MKLNKKVLKYDELKNEINNAINNAIKNVTKENYQNYFNNAYNKDTYKGYILKNSTGRKTPKSYKDK